MGVVNISELGDTIVIHFQSDRESINAYTLASTLVAVADAAKAANASLNPGYDIEVVVEAVGPGSFRARLSAVYAKARNLFSEQTVKTIILSLIASYIYERTLSVDNRVQVQVNTNEVVITHGDDRVIVPRTVYDAIRVAERSPSFTGATSRVMQSVVDDETVSGLGFVPEITSPSPGVVATKSELQQAAITDSADEPLTRIIEEQCELQIVKAILERSTRKWEFVWRGIRISAPITDVQFYSRFFAHSITIAPGDILKVRLAIKQSRDPQTGIYTNLSYEVVEVFEHVTTMRQMPL